MYNILNVVNHINKNDNKSKVITIKDEIIISIYEMSELRIVKINDENVYQDLIDKKLS